MRQAPNRPETREDGDPRGQPDPHAELDQGEAGADTGDDAGGSADELRPIRVLDETVVDQIAAGEVVERPASVVKELVENSLDAGAGHIAVEVEQGGKRLIRIIDDGIGMTPDSVKLALRRHATSKLRGIDDLFDLVTMGFRGEALPSIASVSRLTVTTRTRQAVAAARVVVEAGKVVDEQLVGAPVGTTIEVRDLLYCVPARLKFLKGDATEASHITDAVSRLAMANPGIHMRLKHGARNTINVPPHRDYFERARALMGSRFGNRIHRASGQEGGVTVEAFLAAPELAQSTSRGVQLYVGRRPVRDRGLLHAVNMGYGELVPKGRYPVAVVFVEVANGAVDVNVHPQKAEVRFADAQAVYAAVRHTLARAISSAPWLSEAPGTGATPVRMRSIAPTQTSWSGRGGASDLAGRYAKQQERSLFSLGGARGRGAGGWRMPPDVAHAPVELKGETGGARSPEPRPAAPGAAQGSDTHRAVVPPGSPAVAGGGEAPGPSGAAAAESGPRVPYVDADAAGEGPGHGAVASVPAPPSSTDAGELDASTFFSSLEYLGQLDRTYLLCQGPGDLILIDQHAAHERVAFQRLRERYAEKAMPVQTLLFPVRVELSEAEAAVVTECAEELASVGFAVEPFGGTTFALKSVPAGLQGEQPERVLRDLLADLAELGGSRAVEERIDHVFATIACHSVVRAGDALSPAEVRALLESMDGVDFKAHCPHGRPVLLRISVNEIARRFGRT